MSNWSVLLNNISDSFGFEQAVKNINKDSSGAVVDGIDGFVFSRVKEEEVSLSSSITDYPVEDGNVAQNVITLNPERVKLSGVVAEVTYGGKGLLSQLADRLSASLLPIGTLIPSLSSITTRIYNSLNNTIGELAELNHQLDSIVNAASNAADALEISNPSVADKMTIQEKAYAFLSSCWKSRRLLTIETPWRYFDDMAIEELRFVQSENSRVYSDIEVTFKRIIAPHTRQNEKVTTRQGRNDIGEGGLFSKAVDIGKTVVGDVGTIASEMFDAVGQVITGDDTSVELSIVQDISVLRGGLE